MLALATLLTRFRWVRACVLLVACVVAGGAWAPAFVVALGGGPEHVCHCSARGGHATCACPICVPELREDAPAVGPAVAGTCGDEEHALGTFAVRGVAPSSVVGVLPAPVVGLELAVETWDHAGLGRPPPPTPPPEVDAAARS